MCLCFNSVWSLRFCLPYREVYSRYLRPWQVSLLWNHRKDWRASHRQCLLGPRLSGKRGTLVERGFIILLGAELSYSLFQILQWKYLPEALSLEIFGLSTNTLIILGLNTITWYYVQQFLFISSSFFRSMPRMPVRKSLLVDTSVGGLLMKRSVCPVSTTAHPTRAN